MANITDDAVREAGAKVVLDSRISVATGYNGVDN
jgi:hypothetical protein